MELKEMLPLLEQIINDKMNEFTNLGKKLNDTDKKIRQLNDESKSLGLKMAYIVKELEPVEEIVLKQNPQLTELFGDLKKTFLDKK